MSQIKIAAFNLEWMISVFGAPKKGGWNGKIPKTFPGKTMGSIRLAPIDDVPGLCQRIAGVIRDVDAQVLGFEEGPPEKAMMEKFVAEYLGGQYVVHLSNYNQQTIGALVHKSIANQVQTVGPNDPGMGVLPSKIPYYPWLGYREKDKKTHKFARVPLVLRFQPGANRELTLVVVHTKSLYSKLKTAKQWQTREKAAVLDALDARQKLSAEVACLRQFLDKRIDASPQAPPAIAVMGDFNDGPFQDVMEEEFLIRNILDELVGSLLKPASFFQHAMDAGPMQNAWSVEFPDAFQQGKTVQVLIDHLLVSPGIWQKTSPFSIRPGTCQVEQAAYNQHNDATAAGTPRDERPSDHRPISAILDY